MPDCDGYPTDAELERVKTWPCDDFAGLFAYLQDVWWYPDGLWEGVADGAHQWHFATAGWSGNEEIVATMRQNRLLWALHWESSHRGGKHVFSKEVAE